MSRNNAEPTCEELDQTMGPVLLEFGASWCGHCRAFEPELAEVLTSYPDIRHIKVEDAPGKLLGRTFGVTLWPTLVFMRDGKVLKEAVRPYPDEIREGLEAITTTHTEVG